MEKEKDLSEWTVKQLKDHLRKLGLKVSGNKSDLIERIRLVQQVESTEFDNYSKFTMVKLKQILKERNLSRTGRKVNLIKRLEEDDKLSSRGNLSPRLQSSTKKSLADIPIELVVNILLNLNDKDLASTCRTDKRATEVCADDSFWNYRIKHVFGYNLSKYKIKDLSYRDMYKFFIAHQKFGGAKYRRMINDAIRSRYLPILKYIIEEIRLEHNIDIDYALPIAALSGNLNIFKYLVNKGGNVYSKFYNYTVFSTAAEKGKLNIIKYIVKNLEPDEANLNKALDRASARSHSSIIRLLINAGATDVNIALEYAAIHRDLNMIKYLIEEAGANNFNTALSQASEGGSLDIIKYLVEAGATKLTKALNKSLSRGFYDIVEYLVEKGADIKPALKIAE